MIAVDTNILVYAHRREVREHDAALHVLRKLSESKERWAIPWPCVFEFLSVVTNTKIWRSAASSQEQAWLQLEAWTSSPSVVLLSEPRDFAEVLKPLVQRSRVIGGMVHDARVAALCLAHGVEALLSRDRDFSLFPELKVENPLRR